MIFRKYSAITLWPFIIMNKKFNQKERLLNHERIHLQQQLELLVIFFYLWYGIEFMIRYLILRNWDQAYRTISFEREAYQNEKNFEYLKDRSLFSFLDYYKK